ncbi:C39 family peptidase [Brevibacillus sp. MCWH]|uniref:C39 family peptidase n=1 Tax=Brevibacillus sp. MCWH TaxID=2508871 RepID=UPI00149274D3|nr:C39 family peptidase [Brevibacillus sp. MCWH]NNV01205.1 hypothetical protein [Brevibacillus sp. MCWH]
MATKTFSRDLGTTSFKQFDSKWASKTTSCGGTMRSEGCYITSVAMIFNSFGDNVDPGTLLDNLKNTGKDCPIDWNAAASRYSHTYHGKMSGTFDKLKADIFDLIVNERIPVMIHVPNHLVAAKGFKGTLSVDVDGSPYYSQITPEMILVNDPGSSSNQTLQDVINQRGAVDYYTYYTD